MTKIQKTDVRNFNRFPAKLKEEDPQPRIP
jgi:hypothetical protein